jgi:type I restriction enzyme S subunit
MAKPQRRDLDGDVPHLPDLPEGWAIAPLSALTRPSSLKAEPSQFPKVPYVGLEHIEGGSGRIVGAGTSGDVKSTKTVFKAGDILYGKLRPYLNKVAIPDFDGICSTDIFVFPGGGSIRNAYLKYVLSAHEFVEYANHRSSGIQLPRVNFEAIAEYPVPLPPLAEQKRIDAKVDDLLARVDAARESLANVATIPRRFRQSVLAAACSGRLTAAWRESHTGVEPASAFLARARFSPKERQNLVADIPCLHVVPTTWTWIRFGLLVANICSGTTEVPKVQPTTRPVLRSSSVRPRHVNLDDVRYLPERRPTGGEQALREGDLLFTRLSGSLDFVGNAAVVRELGGREIQFPDRIFRTRLFSDGLANFAEIAFANPLVRDDLASRAKSSAGHQRISIGAITEQAIPFPPLPEQHEIVQRVEALFQLADAIEKRVAMATSSAERLTQSILAKAFRGELVPTEAELARREDREYEPASVILARVVSNPRPDQKSRRERSLRRSNSRIPAAAR